jgi:hypothetical protein
MPLEREKPRFCFEFVPAQRARAKNVKKCNCFGPVSNEFVITPVRPFHQQPKAKEESNHGLHRWARIGETAIRDIRPIRLNPEPSIAAGFTKKNVSLYTKVSRLCAFWRFCPGNVNGNCCNRFGNQQIRPAENNFSWCDHRPKRETRRKPDGRVAEAQKPPLGQPREHTETVKELERLKTVLERGQPFGSDRWETRIARKLNLEHTLRREGRPSRKPDVEAKRGN